MLRFLLAIAVIIAIFYGMNYIRRQPPQNQRKLWIKAILIGAAVTLGLMALTGRMHWIGLVFAALLPLVKTLGSLAIRFMPILGPILKRRAERYQAQVKSTTTKFLQFVVDDNGDMGGLIVQGSLAGKQLKDLTDDQLLAFLKESQSCVDTQRVLVAYLNKYHPHLVRQKPSATSGDMSQKEAEEILGLSHNYSKKDVIDAHRKLMQKLHPDRGGNDYLASKINAAKEKLISLL